MAASQCFKGGHVLRVDRDENVDVVVNPADPARPEYFAVPGSRRLTLAPVRSKRGQAGPAVAEDAGASLP